MISSVNIDNSNDKISNKLKKNFNKYINKKDIIIDNKNNNNNIILKRNNNKITKDKISQNKNRINNNT